MCRHDDEDVDLCLFQFQFPKSGWTGVLVAARYGFADIVRELITKFGCDRNAVNEVSACDSPVFKVVL